MPSAKSELGKVFNEHSSNTCGTTTKEGPMSLGQHRYPRSAGPSCPESTSSSQKGTWPFSKIPCHCEICFSYVRLSSKETFIELGCNCFQCAVYFFIHSVEISSFALPFMCSPPAPGADCCSARLSRTEGHSPHYRHSKKKNNN